MELNKDTYHRKGFYLRPSRASKRSMENKSRNEAVEICKKLYPELEKQDRYYWLTHMVHHIDKNPLNNNPNNLAIILKRDHRWYHTNIYKVEEEFCSVCKKTSVFLNDRCPQCGKRFRTLSKGII